MPSGPPPPPVVAKVRLRYSKRGRLRFTSHRDVARVFERAVRRAGLPIAFSAGFSPHPKISWIGAAPTGVASEAEYVEFGLRIDMPAAQVGALLDSCLPPGLDVLDAVPAGPGSLADRMEASVWRLELPGVSREAAAAAVAAFLAADAVPVQRRTKDGTREVDARSAVLDLALLDWCAAGLGAEAADTAEVNAQVSATPCAILRVVVRHLTPAVRPDDVLAGLRVTASLDLVSPAVATRLAQGPLCSEGADARRAEVTDPLAPDRVPRQVVAAGNPA